MLLAFSCIVILITCYFLFTVILFTKTDIEFEEKFYKANKLYKE